MQELRGRVAVVTGGGSGIGRAVAITLAREGMGVAVADVKRSAADAVAREITAEGGAAIPIAVNVGRRDAVEHFARRVYAHFGAVHLLCNNAGVIAETPLTTPEEGNWRWLVEVNLFGVVYCLQTFVPLIKAQGGEAHIVNTASTAGLTAGPETRRSAYIATKYAVVGLSEALHDELEGSGVGVSVLCPGMTRTDIFHHAAVDRPEQYGGPAPSPGSIADLEASGRAWPGLMDPFETAARVVRGVRANSLYIMTHPEHRPAVEQRFQRMLAAFDEAETYEL